MEKNIAIVCKKFDVYNDCVKSIYRDLNGNKSVLVKGPIIEIEQDDEKTIYHFVSDIEHARGRIFDHYALILGFVDVDGWDVIERQLKLHSATLIEI